MNEMTVPRLDPALGQEPFAAREGAVEVAIAHFHDRSSAHRPNARARLFHDNERLHVCFRVEDQFVRSVVTEHNGPVCTDSCVEIFLRPRPEEGYINFETNAGGTMLMSFVEDWRREGLGGLAKATPIGAGAGGVQAVSTLPATIDPERGEPTTWELSLVIPVAVYTPYLGELGPLSGQTWTGNLYKCGDNTSQPHWAAWNNVEDPLNFHKPDRFGTIHFA